MRENQEVGRDAMVLKADRLKSAGLVCVRCRSEVPRRAGAQATRGRVALRMRTTSLCGTMSVKRDRTRPCMARLWAG